MEKEALGGMWGLALGMIIFISWILYRYLSPKSWKEWRSAGLVQAFIIALYAEMYGFPLTIYLLTSTFKVDIPWVHSNGHLWSFFIREGSAAANIEMFFGYLIVFAGIYLISIGWRQIYEARRDKRLVTDGVYTLMRHPQYMGIFLVILGQLIHWPTLITLILTPVIIFAYYHLARKEERDMIALFGGKYYGYMHSVPMFFPGMNGLRAFAANKGKAA